jgi:hypothetical protein
VRLRVGRAGRRDHRDGDANGLEVGDAFLAELADQGCGRRDQLARVVDPVVFAFVGPDRH